MKPLRKLKVTLNQGKEIQKDILVARKPIADSIADELLVDAEVLQMEMKQAKGLSSFVYWEELYEEVEPVAEVEVKAEVVEAPADSTTPDINDVREEYKKKMGKKAFPGWSVEQLIEKMNQK